jgi:hypothetical protein
MAGDRFPAGAKSVFVYHSIHIGSEVHPPSYPKGASFLRIKRLGCEANTSI